MLHFRVHFRQKKSEKRRVYYQLTLLDTDICAENMYSGFAKCVSVLEATFLLENRGEIIRQK